MKYLKYLEYFKKSGDRFNDPYFEEDMWYISLLINLDKPESNTIFRDNSLIWYSERIIKYLNKNNIQYRIYFWDNQEYCYGIYFFLNEDNFNKLNNLEKYNLFNFNFFPKKVIEIKKTPDKFEYPDNFEENILTTIKDIKLRLKMRFFINKFNV